MNADVTINECRDEVTKIFQDYRDGKYCNTRGKAIETLMTLYTDYEHERYNLKAKNADTNTSGLDTKMDALNLAIQALEQTQWRPASEPPKNNDAMCPGILYKEFIVKIHSLDTDEIYVTTARYYFRDDEWWDDAYDLQYCKRNSEVVIGWMPLPPVKE
jgi:hypothetical protein